MNEVKGALAMIALFFGFATLLIASENHPVVAQMNEQLSRDVTSQIEAPVADHTGQANTKAADIPLEDVVE